MGLRFRSLTGILMIVAAATVPVAATAQSASSSTSSGYATPAEVFNRVYFTNDPDFFHNDSAGRQLNFMFGIGSLLRNSFPENEITRDAELIDSLYKDTLKQQVSSGPIIRTRDLPNPYETSVLQNPSLKGNSPVAEREVVFETQPPQ